MKSCSSDFTRQQSVIFSRTKVAKSLKLSLLQRTCLVNLTKVLSRLIRSTKYTRTPLTMKAGFAQRNIKKSSKRCWLWRPKRTCMNDWWRSRRSSTRRTRRGRIICTTGRKRNTSRPCWKNGMSSARRSWNVWQKSSGRTSHTNNLSFG